MLQPILIISVSLSYCDATDKDVKDDALTPSYSLLQQHTKQIYNHINNYD